MNKSISETEIVELETKIHPIKDISKTDVKRMYYWFNLLNPCHTSFQQGLIKIKKLRDSSDGCSKRFNASFLNAANLSYPDREFIEKHVFIRGYSDDFAQIFRNLWNEIETTGKILPMLGASTENLPAPRSEVDFDDYTQTVEEKSEEMIKSAIAKG